MPFSLPSRTPSELPLLPSRTSPGPRRRSLFAGAAGAVLLVGCSSASESGTTGGGSLAADRARARVARDSEALAGRYAAVIAAHPALAGLLEPLRDEAVRHAEAFGGGASAIPSATSSSSSPGSGSSSASPVPGDEKSALAELAAAERELVERRTKALLEVPVSWRG